MILPHITYCIEIWGNAFATHLEPIRLLQKKIARLITFSDFCAPTSNLFKQLDILDIHKLCKLHTCLFIFDLLKNRFAHDINHYLDTIPHDYPTRFASVDNFYIPRTTLTLNKHNIKYAATSHWNSLPNHIKTISNRKLFVTTLKTYLINM